MHPSVAVLSGGLRAPLSSAMSRGLAFEVERDLPCTGDESMLKKIPGRQQSFQGAQHRSMTVGDRVTRHGFKGVRQRTGVRGYLVEIRPPKWKKTIWLGTYNTAEEAGGAYDAGIFYTRKTTKYNFPELKGTFPPLPSTLRLESADDQEKIKTFVQQQARNAARHARTNIMKTCETTKNMCQIQIMNKEMKNRNIKREAEPSPDVAAIVTAPDASDDCCISDFVNLEGVAPTTTGVAPTGYCSDSNESTRFIVPLDSQHHNSTIGEDRSGGFQWAPHVQAESHSQDWQRESNSKSYAVGRKRWCAGSCDAINEDSLMSRLTPYIRKQVKEAINYDRSVNTPGDRSINDGDLIFRLAPSIRKEVAEALSSTLLPLVSALRSREEDEQKHREKLLALETQKLALKRAKLLLERRRVSRCQPHPRASSLSENRVMKNPSAR